MELLEKLACPPTNSTVKDESAGSPRFDLQQWISKHGLEVEGPRPWNGGQKFIFDICPWNGQHRKSAFAGQLANGALVAGCLHGGCSDKNWHSLRDLVEPGWRQNRSNEVTGATAGTDAWEAPIPFHEFDLPCFLIEAFPTWLREFAEAEAIATQTPVELAAMLCMSVLAAACSKKVIVQVKAGYCEPVNIFTVTALPSGNRKSSVFGAVIRPLVEHEAAEAKRTAGEIARQQAARKIKEGRLKKVQDEAVNATANKRDELTAEVAALGEQLATEVVRAPTRYVADDCTPEKLAGLLREQDGRIAVMSPEGEIFDLLAGRYSSNGAGNFGVFLNGHAGDPLRIDRVGRPPEYVEAPALTVGLAVQPEVIRGLADKPGFRGRGLLARFLYALPVSLLGRRDPDAPTVPPEVSQTYHDRLTTILSIPLLKVGDADSRAFVLTLEPRAQGRLLEFAKWVEPRLAEFGELGGIADWGGKLVGAVVRIAGLLHMAVYSVEAESWKTPIADQTIERAILIGQFLIPHSKAAHAEMGADAVLERAKKVLRWIDEKGIDSFTRRDLHQAMRSVFKKAADVEPSLEVLVDRNFIRRHPETGNGGVGRPGGPAYDVSPLLRSQKPRGSVH
jgi:replicative DNA helicase